MDKLNEKTLKELKVIAVVEGMGEEMASEFRAKAALASAIRIMREKPVEVAKEPVEAPKEVPVKRVETIADVASPKETKNANKQWLGKAARMRDRLAAQPKTIIMLPLEGKEKPGVVEDTVDKHGNFCQIRRGGAVETVQLNGYKYLIPKGVQAKIPTQVAEVLGESMQLTSNAGRQWLIDRTDPETGRPISDSL